MSTISSILPIAPDNFSTQIASATVSPTQLSVALDDATGLPTEGVGQFFKKDANGNVVAGSIEFVHWTNVSGNTLTFSDTGDRGITGSDSGAQSYVADDYFEVWVTSYYFPNDELDNVFTPSTGAIDTTKVVTPTATQTLTNKTLISPKINEDVALTATATELNLLGGKTSLSSGGRYVMIVPGTAVVGTDVAGTWFVPVAGTISSISLYADVAGDTGSTVIDVNKNGTSIFPSSTKPTLATTATADEDVVPDTTEIAQGDKITIDIDSVTTTAQTDLYILIKYLE